jgi:hypothetical protein
MPVGLFGIVTTFPVPPPMFEPALNPTLPPGRPRSRRSSDAPDGVLTLQRVAGRLVAARVDDLEVVDEAVGSEKTPSPSTSLRVPHVERSSGSR